MKDLAESGATCVESLRQACQRMSENRWKSLKNQRKMWKSLTPNECFDYPQAAILYELTPRPEIRLATFGTVGWGFESLRA